jgi:hypothetical protein
MAHKNAREKEQHRLLPNVTSLTALRVTQMKFISTKFKKRKSNWFFPEK